MSAAKRAITPDSKEHVKKKKVPSNSPKRGSEEDWRDKCSGILEVHSYALSKGILTDITFLVGPDSTVFHAHKSMLALGSPVFEAMFFGSLAEQGPSVSIPDIDPEGFNYLLKYLYVGDYKFDSHSDAFKTFVAADKYCVTHLKMECQYFLNSYTLTLENIWDFLEYTHILNSKAVLNRCIEFLQNNTEDAIRQSKFLEINCKSMEIFIILDNLKISENSLLSHVIKWADYKSKQEGVSLQEIITPFLQFIRFGSLTPKQFILLLESETSQNILSKDDSLSILKHLCLPGKCRLPDWCCKKPWRCPTFEKYERFGEESTDLYKSNDFDDDYADDVDIDDYDTEVENGPEEDDNEDGNGRDQILDAFDDDDDDDDDDVDDYDDDDDDDDHHHSLCSFDDYDDDDNMSCVELNVSSSP